MTLRQLSHCRLKDCGFCSQTLLGSGRDSNIVSLEFPFTLFGVKVLRGCEVRSAEMEPSYFELDFHLFCCFRFSHQLENCSWLSFIEIRQELFIIPGLVVN